MERASWYGVRCIFRHKDLGTKISEYMKSG